MREICQAEIFRFGVAKAFLQILFRFLRNDKPPVYKVIEI